MLATAVAIVTNVDVSFDQLVAREIPEASLSASLERSDAVAKRLRTLNERKARFAEPVPAGIGPGAHGLPKLGRAPEFTGTQRWFNTLGGRPAPLRSLRGRVVLVDFWTYTCINCLRTLPYLEAWDRRYRDAGLTIVGVHTPEFAFEHNAGNVGRAIKRLGIRYPVVQDNDDGTWDAYANMYWPADYLVDASGQVRYASIGEGDYDKTENAIRLLLAEAGHRRLGGDARPEDVVVPSKRTSPETYLGTQRAEGWIAGEPQAGENQYPSVAGKLAVNTFAFGGTWNVGEQAATAVRGATIDATVQARNVYLVLSPPRSGRGTVQVLVDGKPARAGVAGAGRGGRGLPRRPRDGDEPAPLHPRVPAAQRAPRAEAPPLARRVGVRVHVRVGHGRPRARRADAARFGAPMNFRSLYDHGFARVASCTGRIAIADPPVNAEVVLKLARECADDGVALALFPEMNLVGYSIEDLVLQDAVLDGAEAAVETVVAGSADLPTALVFGTPLRHRNRIYNCAVVAHRGRVLGVVPKSYPPNSREF